MGRKATLATALALLAAAALPLSAANHWEPNCPHSSPHSHTYVLGVVAGVKSSGALGAGFVSVAETNTVDCDGDSSDPVNGETADFDGDYDLGGGGGFFGFGPWAHEPVCDFALTQHGGVVSVNDVLWGSDVAFVVGAVDTSGPDLTPDPVSGEPACTTDGSITPGDPSLDPTADADDCMTEIHVGSGFTCGAGGDGGYWVFIVEGGGGGAAATPDDEFTALMNEVGGLAIFCPPCPPGMNCCTANCLGGLFCCTIVCPKGSVPDCRCSLTSAECKCVAVGTSPGGTLTA